MSEVPLPTVHESVRCAAFARSNQIRPTGSGLRLDRIVTIAAPLPWPKPALKHELLHAMSAPLTASSVSTRLFAVEPAPRGDTSAGSATDSVHAGVFSAEVQVYDRLGVGAVQSDRSVRATSATELHQALADRAESIAASPLGDVDGASSMLGRSTLLICTQGNHDDCCGVHGVALADAVQSDPALSAHVSVRRVSHTGGHRFAPTLIELPSGRMWAFADVALIRRLVDAAPTPDDLRERCRGWWGTSPGPKQVAEIEARAAFGSPFVQSPLIDAGPPDEPIRVTHGSDVWDVAVEVGREVPIIACGTPGGMPVKSGREFRATIVATASHSPTHRSQL